MRIQRSVVWADSFVGKGAEIGGTLVGQHAIIKDFVTCHEGVVIGDRCRIGQAQRCNHMSRFGPIKSLNPGRMLP